MARKLLGCGIGIGIWPGNCWTVHFYNIEKGSSNSLNKAVNVMDLLSLVFLLYTQSPVLDKFFECAQRRSPRLQPIQLFRQRLSYTSD